MPPLSVPLPQSSANKASRKYLFTAAIVHLLLLFYGGVVPTFAAENVCRPYCQKVSPANVSFFDDTDRSSLIAAINSQLQWLTIQPANTMVHFGSGKISCSHIARALETLLRYIRKNPTPSQLNRYIKKHYDIYQIKGCRPQKKLLVTAYYEPTFAGSRKQSNKAQWPIYRLPNAHGPLPVRAEIENRAIFKGRELAWLNDPFDAYLLHIQGSGKIRFSDGTIRAVRYAGNNGHPYKSLGKLFVDRGILPLKEVDNISMRNWLTAHPDRRREMLQANPRFIFFRWGDEKNINPIGSSGVQLTPGRSIAIDPAIFPAGGLGFLFSRKPKGPKTQRKQTLHRFVFPQDKGAAIKGPGRIDLFLGSGKAAEQTANIMREPGILYFLLLKGTPVKQEKCCQ